MLVRLQSYKKMFIIKRFRLLKLNFFNAAHLPIFCIAFCRLDTDTIVEPFSFKTNYIVSFLFYIICSNEYAAMRFSTNLDKLGLPIINLNMAQVDRRHAPMSYIRQFQKNPAEIMRIIESLERSQFVCQAIPMLQIEV